MNLPRWKEAQKAEEAHVAHTKLPTNDEAWNRFENYGFSKAQLRGKRVAAIGAGTGAIHSLEVDCERIALDPLMQSYSNIVEESYANVLTGAAENIPFNDESFDIIICHNVLDHCAKPAEVLDEIHRVLTEKGQFLFHLNIFKIPSIVRKQLHHIDRPHPHHYSLDEVKTLFRDHDWKIDRSRIWKPSRPGGNIKGIVANRLFRLHKIEMVCSKAISGSSED